MPTSTEYQVKIVADDRKIYQVSTERDKLQADIDRVLSWTEKWQLPLNESKCKVKQFKKITLCSY